MPHPTVPNADIPILETWFEKRGLSNLNCPMCGTHKALELNVETYISSCVHVDCRFCGFILLFSPTLIGVTP